MTTDRDLDRQLGSWLDERATANVPDGLLERSLARVDVTRQRPGWLVRDRGRSPRAMGLPSTAPLWATLLLVLALAAVAIAAGAGLLQRRSAETNVAPSTAPAVVPVPSTSVAPSPSPSARPKPGMFAFIQGVGYAGQLWVANTDGTGARQLAPNLAGSKGAPAWSTDGTRLVFTLTPMGGMGGGYPNPGGEGSRLYLTDASGTTPQLVETGCVAPCRGDTEAAFSPDGTRLVFVRVVKDVGSVLATIDLSNGRVVELASTMVGPHGHFPSGDPRNHQPRWSPDGKQIVFTQDVSNDAYGKEINGWPTTDPRPAVFVVDADGRNLRKIGSSAYSGGWSPDGARIVLASATDVSVPRAGSGTGYVLHQYFDIYTVRPDGTDLRRLTSDQISQEPSWTASGRIEFSRDPALVNGVVTSGPPRQLWIMDADGGNATQLSVSTQLVDAWPISWPAQP